MAEIKAGHFRAGKGYYRFPRSMRRLDGTRHGKRGIKVRVKIARLAKKWGLA